MKIISKIIITIIVLIYILSLISSAESIEIVGNDIIPTYDNSIIKDHNGIEYSVQGDGIYKVEYDIKRILGFKISSKTSYFMFGISGEFNGGTNFKRLSNFYTWNTNLYDSGNSKRVISSTPNNEWITEFLFTSTKTKITNTLTNKLAYQINDSNFYYIFSINDGDVINYNDGQYIVPTTPNLHLSGNFNKKIPYFSLNNNLLFDYNDLIETGYNITDIYIKPASALGLNYNKNVIVLQFKKDGLVIQPSETVVFDPSINQVGGTLTLNGNHTYDYVNLSSGAILYIAAYNGSVNSGMLNLTVLGGVNIDSTSSINGVARGWTGGAGGTGSGNVAKGGNGTGGGAIGGYGYPCYGGGGAGGGSYATVGNSGGCTGGVGGSTYGTISGWDIEMGSGGGGGGGQSGTCNGQTAQGGGALLRINSYSIIVSGIITMVGGLGGDHATSGTCTQFNGGGGGASGGGILLNATIINLNSATITTEGGLGGADCCNPPSDRKGGNGRLKIFYKNSFSNTSTSVTSGSVYYLQTNTAPTIPSITNPISGSYHWNGTINITWSASTDLEGDPISYNWQMATDSGFVSIVASGSTSNTYSGSKTSTSGNVYYLRVNSTDGVSTSSQSTIVSYTEKTLLIPTITSPTNFSNQNNYTLNITFTVSTSTTTILHNWQISESSVFSTIFLQGNSTNVSFSGFQSLTNNKTYYVRVKSNMSTQGQVSDWSSVILFYHVRNETVAVYPINKTTLTTTAIHLSWTDGYSSSPYTWIISKNSDLSSPLSSGIEYLTYSALKNSSILELSSGTTYYWRVTNSTGSISNIFEFNISSAAVTPGRLNFTVFDENNLSRRIENFKATIYNNSYSFSNTTSNGWTNFTQTQLSSGEYLMVVEPLSPDDEYYSRSILFTSPVDLTAYVPNSTSPNTINIITFSISDVTGLFPYQTSVLTISKGGLIMDKSYFAPDGTHPVNLLYGNNYQISVTNGNNVFYGNNLIPLQSTSVPITINNFSVNNSGLYPFAYNITDTNEKIILNWQSRSSGILNILNFTVHKGNTMVLYCQQTSTLQNGQSLCLIDNTSQFHVIFSALMTDGRYMNTSYFVDYTYGHKKSSTGVSTIDGSPIGIGYVFNYGTFVMPIWVYNWGSLLLIILLAGTFGGYHSGFGSIITGVIALLFEGVGWLQPLGDGDIEVGVVMGITGALTLLSVLYYLQHKDRGG